MQSRRFCILKLLITVTRHLSGSVKSGSAGPIVVVVDTGPIVVVGVGPVVVVVDTGPIVVVGVGPVVVVVDTGPIVVVGRRVSIQSTTFLNPPLDF